MTGMVDTATQTSDTGSDDEVEKMVGNASPRVVIDTSPPFGSVEEAVVRFGGRGFWIPRPFLPVDASHNPHDPEEPGIYKLEDRAAAMLKDLHMKEQETIEILKELELTKRLVEELKLKLPKEDPGCMPIPSLGFDGPMSTPNKEYMKKDPISSSNNVTRNPQEHSQSSLPTSTTDLIMTEIKKAKLNLSHSNNELAAIRASVESLSKKMEMEKDLVEKARELQTFSNMNEARSNMSVRNDAENLGGSVNPLVISRELRELNYEAEQFMKTAEAARSEVLKAMSDVEQTKTGLKVIEMRWVAAKKLEEAARATESLALAEMRALSSNDSVEGYQQKPGRISLSLEEYSALTDKARKAENLLWRKDLDDPFRKIEEATQEKLNKMALDEVLGRVDVANRRHLSAGEAMRRFRSDPPQLRPPVGAHSDFRNSFQPRPRRDSRLLDANEFDFMRNESRPVLRPTTSIGEILSRKLVLRDDLDVGRQEEGRTGRPRVSLNQMLRQQRGESSPPPLRREKDGAERESKKFFSKRKGFGFVHISLPMSKNSKNKIQSLNLW